MLAARGAYLLAPAGPHGGPEVLERFSCGPSSSGAGPLGWRYAATREDAATGRPLGGVDVVLDARGAAVRVQVAAGGWLLRGGTAGSDVLWRRGEEERSEPAAGFTGSSPVWAASAARLAGEGPVRLRLVSLGDEALATRVVEQAWTRTGGGEHAGLPSSRHEALDLETGRRRAVEVAGGLVVAMTGAALVALERD